MHARRVVPAIVLAGACALTAAGAAAAGMPPKSPPPAATVSLAAPGKAPPAVSPAAGARMPRGYTVVSSGVLSSPVGTQVRGTATCPFPLVPLGGGVFIQSLSTLASVNSSFPTSTGWVGDVNNGSDAATTFSVSVICAQRPKVYAIVGGDTVSNPAGEATASVQCPAHMKPFSGGVLSSSGSIFVNVGATINSTRGWVVRENNASSGGDTIAPFAICGKVSGYAAVVGVTVPNPANTQTFSFATCPAGSVVIGGGTNTNSTSVGVNVNSSIVSGLDWHSDQNNATAVGFLVLTEVICAGVAS